MYVKGESDTDQGNQLYNWVAKVRRIVVVENEERLEVTWMYDPCDLPRDIKRRASCQPSEIFNSNHQDEICVESVMCLAEVSEIRAAGELFSWRTWDCHKGQLFTTKI